MIGKGLFIETIELMKTKRKQEQELIKALENCCPKEYINAFIYNEYEVHTIKLLKEGLGLDEDDSNLLDYWVWELDFGEEYKKGSIVDENDNPLQIDTVEKLYDFLTDNFTPQALEQKGGSN